MSMDANALEIKDLRKSYGDFTLDGLSLTLPRGCIMGLVGENGAGKSTTIKLILGMIKKDGGSVRIFGEDPMTDMEALKEDIGVVPDEIGFPDFATAEIIGRIMKNVYRNWEQSVYEDFLKKMDIPKDRKFKEYSRGMRMKLGIAAALSHRPKLLLLDEATNGLDPVVRDEVVELFSEFTRQEDHAVLISSHIVSDLEKICDYIAFLHKGKLLLCEEKDRLLEQYGMLHCTGEQLAGLMPEAVIGKRESAYGAEALVKRNMLPAGWETSPVSLEELFVFMVKGSA